MKRKIILLIIILVGLCSCKSEKEKFYNTFIKDEIRKKVKSPSTVVFPPYDKIKHEFLDTKFYGKEVYSDSYERWSEYKRTGKYPTFPNHSEEDEKRLQYAIDEMVWKRHDFENDTIKKYEGMMYQGYIDSQNSYGAIVRSYYFGSAYHHDKDDEYKDKFFILYTEEQADMYSTFDYDY